jgi:hypothetical protein
MCSEVMLHSVRKFHCTFYDVTVSCITGICKVSTLLDLFGHLRTRCILKKVLTEESVNEVDARLEEKVDLIFWLD